MKEYKRFFMLMLFLSAVGLITGTYYDYNIASFLFDDKNWISIFLESTVYYPLYFAAPVLGNLILMENDKKNIKYTSYIINTFILFAIMMSSLLFLKKRSIYIIDFKISIILAFLAAIILECVLYRILKNTNLHVRGKLKIISIAGMALIVWKFTFVSGLKILIGRARYCDIVHGIGYYTPWYVINRPTMGKSFPSGHVSGACGIMVLLFLPLLFDEFKKHKIKFEMLVLIYILGTAFSRMILGKHMLSDVSAAMFVMTSGFMVVIRIFDKLKRHTS